METWYRAQFGEIVAVQVKKVTDKTVTLDGARSSSRIDADWRWFRQDREQAKAAMCAQYIEERDTARMRLQYAEENLAKAQNA